MINFDDFDIEERAACKYDVDDIIVVSGDIRHKSSLDNFITKCVHTRLENYTFRVEKVLVTPEGICVYEFYGYEGIYIDLYKAKVNKYTRAQDIKYH